MNDTAQRLLVGGVIELSLLAAICFVWVVSVRLHTVARVITTLIQQKKDEKKGETCKQCGKEWFRQERYCTFCGTEGEWHMTCVLCYTIMPRSSRYCPHCRNRMWLSGSNTENVHMYGSPVIGVNTVHVEKVTRAI